MGDSELVKIPAGHGKAARLSAGQKLKLINTHRHPGGGFLGLSTPMTCASTSASRPRGLEPASLAGGGRCLGDHPAPPDSVPGRGHHARHSRHHHGRLRPPSLWPLGLRGLPSQLPGQHVRGSVGAGCHPTLPGSGLLERLHEHPDHGGRLFHRHQADRLRAGQYIVLQAEIDCYMVFSACPQDVLPIHGEGGAPPQDCHFQLID